MNIFLPHTLLYCFYNIYFFFVERSKIYLFFTGSTVQAGRLSLPEIAKTQHDTSGLVARARRKLTICEEQLVGNICAWRTVVNDILELEASFIVQKETGMISGEFGALTLGMEAGSLNNILRVLLQKWISW